MGIRDNARATALVGILQLAEAHPQGFVGSIGHFVCGAWFSAHVDIFFQDDGPLGTFNPIRPQMLMHHFGVALRQAKDYFNKDIQASNPAQARRRSQLGLVNSFGFSMLWREIHQPQLRQLSLQPTGILGWQAPLGPHQGTQPVQLRTKM
jgi:hypothetical protein